MEKRNETAAEARTVTRTKEEGLSLRQIMLVALLLAAGAVLKFFVGSLFAVGMKPNFIIAMYCLAILLVRPTIKESIIIGLLAGAVCQFFPGTPYLNFASEAAGAVVMALFVKAMPVGKSRFFMPAIATFLSTAISGSLFMAELFALFFSSGAAAPAPAMVFAGIIVGTAAINAIIVQVLYAPAAAALRLSSAR